MPLWTSCRAELAELGTAEKLLQDAVDLCNPSAAHHFLAMCPLSAPASPACIPACGEETHGYFLLLSIDGTDTILVCELSNELYDWLGTADLGGFVGENELAFAAAVNTGAAGTYILKLMADSRLHAFHSSGAGVSTDLTIRVGQTVVISGNQRSDDLPSWGNGGFVVQQLGSLSLSHLWLAGALSVTNGGSLKLNDCELAASITPVIRVSGDGTVSVVHSSFVNLCSNCFAIDASDPASQVTVQQLTAADRPLSTLFSLAQVDCRERTLLASNYWPATMRLLTPPLSHSVRWWRWSVSPCITLWLMGYYVLNV